MTCLFQQNSRYNILVFLTTGVKVVVFNFLNLNAADKVGGDSGDKLMPPQREGNRVGNNLEHKPCEEWLRELKERRLGETLSLPTTTWKESAARWEPCSAPRQMTGQGEMVSRKRAKGGSGCILGKMSLKGWLSTGTSCPGK